MVGDNTGRIPVQKVVSRRRGEGMRDEWACLARCRPRLRSGQGEVRRQLDELRRAGIALSQALEAAPHRPLTICPLRVP